MKLLHNETVVIAPLTLPLSTKLVIMTMTWTFCSQTIRQKASHVSSSGPWVPMYAWN